MAYRLVSTGQGDKIFGLIVMAGLLVHPEAIPSKYSALHTSYVDNGGEVPVVTGEAMLAAFGMLTRENDIHDVDMFPIAGAPKSLAHFPRTYIINTSKEANRDDGRVLEAALEDAGTPVKRDVIPGFPHYFWCFPIEKGGARLRETIVKGIKWVVDPA